MNKDKLQRLFGGWDETVIDSCLWGIMGDMLTDDEADPCSAGALLGDFCFLAGAVCPEIVERASVLHGPGILIFVAREDVWNRYFAAEGRAEKTMRYAIRKEGDVFDREVLSRLAAALPEGYRLARIDRELFERIGRESWCESMTIQYRDWEDFEKLGLGVVALHEDEIVSGASSYSTFSRGIEVEVDTREDHQRRGLAMACAAQLILDCLERGLYPSWDAANLASVALAEKLGYHLDREYTAWEVKL